MNKELNIKNRKRNVFYKIINRKNNIISKMFRNLHISGVVSETFENDDFYVQ